MSMKSRTVILAGVLTCLMTSSGSPAPCPWCKTDVENKVDQIESKVVIMQGRVASITAALMNELTVLQKDYNAIATTAKRLDKDTKEMKDSMSNIGGIGQDVVNLRSRVRDVQKHVSENLDTVHNEMTVFNNNYENEKRAQANVINLLQTQFDQNKGMLDGIKRSMTSQNDTLTSLLQRLDGLQDAMGSGSPASVDSIKGTVTELQQSYNELRQKEDQQVTALRNTIEELRRQMKLREFYPNPDY